MEYAVGKELLPRHFRFQAAFGAGEDFRMMRLVRSFCIKEKDTVFHVKAKTQKLLICVKFC